MEKIHSQIKHLAKNIKFVTGIKVKAEGDTLKEIMFIFPHQIITLKAENIEIEIPEWQQV